LIEHDSKSVSVREQCELLELNRSSLYYKKAEIDVQDLELMKLIDEQYLATPFYVRRRMTDQSPTEQRLQRQSKAGSSADEPDGGTKSGRRKPSPPKTMPS